MKGGSVDHDRAPAAPDREPAFSLEEALGRLRLRGAIFLRGEYSEPWAYESLPPQDVTAILAPGERQLVLFHVVASGRCWIEAGGERHWARAGDVIVLPYNDQHRMGGSDDATPVPIAQILEPPPWERLPVIRHGLGGAATEVVCGYLSCDDALFDPRLRVFPSVFVTTPPPGPAREWVNASIAYALQQTTRVTADRVVSPTSVPELLLAEILKLYLAAAPASTSGWWKALRDPVLAPALAAIHSAPERKWSVETLAREAHASASALDERFRVVLGLAPIRYLTLWRMHLAEELLRTPDMGLVAVAHRVGYESEEAFSRAFKREHSASPSVWRVRRR
ncbi:HTH-type transcriptional activator RhaR [Microbacterium hydrocarbonoxydans]|uniref:HTH-type transcriptional activator RhaR n=1 Tax=Microbacterium hydrocarbonoxydans TaxID=273678 RepID=A0A0M2HVY3_9MICO|nr:HTH-type transcriptional activator RhaR [Microbacterium hydrocarbonoxydans]